MLYMAVCDLWIAKCHLVWGLGLFPSFAIFKLHGCNLDAQHLQFKNHFSNWGMTICNIWVVYIQLLNHKLLGSFLKF